MIRDGDRQTRRRREAGGMDVLDGISWGAIALSAVFLFSFFTQVVAGAAVSEEQFRASLARAASKRIEREREQVRPILEAAASGRAAAAWEEALSLAGPLDGNSQLHLYLARGYDERSLLPETLREYRRAVEITRDYADRRSPFYLGSELHTLVRRARSVYRAGGPGGHSSGEGRTALRDLYYLQRALAGGCG